MSTEPLVTKIDARNMADAVTVAEKTIGQCEAIIQYSKPDFPGGAGVYIAYRYITDAEIYLGRAKL